MSNILWKYIKPVYDEKVIDKFLLQNGITIPRETIDFIKENNGGRPSSKIFDTKMKKGCVFKTLLSYNDDDVETIYACYPGSFKENGLLPIASDPSGNFICIDLKNNYSIMLFNHENEALEFIAVNFSNFLGKLY